MSKKASPIGAIDRALPSVQTVLRDEIAARIAAGEAIGRIENGKLIATRPASRDLASLRKQLLEQHAANKQGHLRHKSIA
jgi:hypothetical protein